jgi:hypothetical protein
MAMLTGMFMMTGVGIPGGRTCALSAALIVVTGWAIVAGIALDGLRIDGDDLPIRVPTEHRENKHVLVAALSLFVLVAALFFVLVVSVRTRMTGIGGTRKRTAPLSGRTRDGQDPEAGDVNRPEALHDFPPEFLSEFFLESVALARGIHDGLLSPHRRWSRQ